MVRIAHVSDLHVPSSAGVEWRRVLWGKRATGFANLLLQRARVHRPALLRPVLEEAARCADHVVVTGDVTNLSLEGEYEAARALLDEVARHVEVTVVPGNHDIYVPVTLRERRFPHHFGERMRGDLPELELDLSAGRFPFVKLRGEVAIVGLSSAVPRPPFVSAGYVGGDQLAALARVLEHPEVASRTPIVLVHHSPHDERSRRAQLRDGLLDAAVLRETLRPLERGVVLYGHLHVRERDALGRVLTFSANSAALDHPSTAVRAGVNVYEMEDGAVLRAEARVYEPRSGRFVAHPIPPRGAA